MNDDDDPWKRLVDAAKTAPVEEEAEPTTQISVRTLRESVQSLLLALTWRKWSLLAALAAAVIFLIFFLLRDDAPAPEPIIPIEPPAAPETP
ncbi:hypothetical protein N9Y81_00560 [Akkermansiaceae bacterium]|jgi:hypothetical protein|nr:hypothetical protein [Akkermansiaceae bacterium]